MAEGRRRGESDVWAEWENGGRTKDAAKEVRHWKAVADKACAEHLVAQQVAAEAGQKAQQYQQDWYAAKSDFGSAMAKMRQKLGKARDALLKWGAHLEQCEEHRNGPDTCDCGLADARRELR